MCENGRVSGSAGKLVGISPEYNFTAKIEVSIFAVKASFRALSLMFRRGKGCAGRQKSAKTAAAETMQVHLGARRRRRVSPECNFIAKIKVFAVKAKFRAVAIMLRRGRGRGA